MMFALLLVPVIRSKSNFCGDDNPFIETIKNAVGPVVGEASALAFNKAGTHLFTVNDSPEGNALVYAMSKDGKKNLVIKITGVTNAGFNRGFGDWEALVATKCVGNADKNCILIGDIGHNCARGAGGRLRKSNQGARFIEIEEPTAEELESGKEISKSGKEYPFTYPQNRTFDAEAMVVKDGKTYVVTKSGTDYKYSHVFEVPPLMEGEVVQLTERAILKVSFSSVTDATSTPEYLILRTYTGINFYKWDELCTSDVRESKTFQLLPYLKRGHGLQEAIAYDAKEGRLYFVGEEKSNLYYTDQCKNALEGDAAGVTTGDACLDNFGGKANGVQKKCNAGTFLDARGLLLVILALCA